MFTPHPTQEIRLATKERIEIHLECQEQLFPEKKSRTSLNIYSLQGFRQQGNTMPFGYYD
jgi:hypothetical protein